MIHLINSIGMQVFGIISICLFIVVFSATMIGSLCLKKPFLQHMEQLPLEGKEAQDNETTITHL